MLPPTVLFLEIHSCARICDAVYELLTDGHSAGTNFKKYGRKVIETSDENGWFSVANETANTFYRGGLYHFWGVFFCGSQTRDCSWGRSATGMFFSFKKKKTPPRNKQWVQFPPRWNNNPSTLFCANRPPLVSGFLLVVIGISYGSGGSGVKSKA